MDIIRFETMILRAEFFPLPPIKQKAISSNSSKESILYYLKYNPETKNLEFIYA